MITDPAYHLEIPPGPVGGEKYIRGKELWWTQNFEGGSGKTYSPNSLSDELGIGVGTVIRWIAKWNQEKAALINRAMVRSLEISPDVPPIMCRLAKVYQGQVEIYLKAIEKDPTDANAIKALNKSLSAWERYSGADVLLLARNQAFKDQMAPPPEDKKRVEPVDVQTERQDWIDDD